MQRLFRIRGLRVCAVLALLLLLAGCGSDDDAQLSTEVDPQELLSQASQRLADTESMRFALDVEGTTYIDDAGTLQLGSAEGDLTRPGRVRVEFQVELFGVGNVTIRMITVGDEAWTTDLLTGDWGPAPEEFGYDPAVLFDNQDGLGPVMGRIIDPVLIGIEDIGGRQAYHVSGTATQEIIGPVTAGTMVGEPIQLDLWIDGETSDLLQIKLEEPETVDKDQPATWTMRLTDHNEPVTIEPPV